MIFSAETEEQQQQPEFVSSVTTEQWLHDLSHDLKGGTLLVVTPRELCAARGNR
jgi:hypothetical protein